MTAALALAAVALALLGTNAPRPSRRAGVHPGADALPLALDLIALALRAGQPVERAVLAAAPAAGSRAEALHRVARLLALGADPVEAWSALADDPALKPIAASAARSAHSGTRLAGTVESLATDLRAQARSAGEARAHRVGVLAAAPLGLCFLPAFVCLGIVPTVLGLVHHAFG